MKCMVCFEKCPADWELWTPRTRDERNYPFSLEKRDNGFCLLPAPTMVVFIRHTRGSRMHNLDWFIDLFCKIEKFKKIHSHDALLYAIQSSENHLDRTASLNTWYVSYWSNFGYRCNTVSWAEFVVGYFGGEEGKL